MFQLDVVGFISAHKAFSETCTLERGWTHFYAGVAQGEMQREGVGLLVAPQLTTCTLEFLYMNESVASPCLRAGEWFLTVAHVYAPNSSS